MDGKREGLERNITDILARMRKRRTPKGNIDAVESWVNFLKARGAHPKTIAKNLYCLRPFLNALPKNTTLAKATRNEIESAMAKVEAGDYSAATKRNIKVVTKAFFKHYLGEDEYYPRQIAWVRASRKMIKRMLPEDILTEGEVLRMIESTSNPRDKAIIALLYDSGIRVGELLSLKKKSVDLDGEPGHVIVDGKTGMRKIPILFSAPYLAGYLEIERNKKADDYLWTGIGTWKESNMLVDGGAIRKVLRLAAKKAGIEKRIYPHLFRHSRATYYANRLTEQQLKALFGWTGDSRMVSTYVHMSGRDIDDAVLQVYGKRSVEAAAPKLTEIICPRCRYANGIDFLHCRRCGASLDSVQVNKEDAMRRAVAEHLDDPKFFDELMQAYLKRQKKKK